MKINNLRSLLTAVLLVVINSMLIGQEEDTERYRGLEVGSETRTLISEINNKNYRLYINLPEGYSKDITKEYPVFYITDAQWHFMQVVSGYGGNHYDGFLPEIIIVGVTWGGKDSDYSASRNSDFTPTVNQRLPNSGGAKKFMEVFRNEIIPFIEREYRTNKVDRALGGSSFGGLITHYALFNTSNLFNAYVICNPSLMYDKGIAFKYEEEFAKSNSELNAKVYMVSGEYDNVPAFEKMVNQINSSNYKGIHLESQVLKGMGHGGATNEAYARGLLSIYKKRGITIPTTAQKEFIGSYEFYGTRKVEIILKDENLALKTMDGRQPSEIYPLGEDKFSLLGKQLDFHFNRDENDKVIGFDMEHAKGQFVSFKRID